MTAPATLLGSLRPHIRLHVRFSAFVATCAMAWTLYAVGAAPTPDHAARWSWTALALGSFALTLRLTSSLVAQEVHSGVWLLWAQTGAGPVRLYLRRLSVRLLLSLVATLVLASATALALAASGWDAPSALLARVPILVLALLVQGILVWACSGWGVRADAATALLLLCLLAGLEVAVKLQPGLFGSLAPLVDVIGLPVDDLVELPSASSPASGLRVCAWSLAWLAVGTAGTAWTTRPAGRGLRSL